MAASDARQRDAELTDASRGTCYHRLVPRTTPNQSQLPLPLQAEPPVVGRQLVRGSVSRDVIDVEGAVVPIRFVRHPRARRYVLRVSSDMEAVVTVPRRGSLREGRRFAERHRAWIARERATLVATAARSQPLSIGDAVLVAGVSCMILPADARTLRIGVRLVPLGTGDVHETVRRWLRAVAKSELPARLRQFAEQHGLAVQSVSIRNQRTRWGSCSTDGRISLNWRLVQMPDDVRDYVLLHELMHLRVRNHSPRFWREVERVCPQHLDARRWLREQGRDLL
jgi:predicted metal-dependent hydrolase